MNTILEIDLVGNAAKILSYGASGLCFLLFFMAFQLIREEQKRAGQPRTGILYIIGVFMLINLGNIIFVGMIGIPAISSNSALAENNDKLANDTLNYKHIINVQNASSGVLSMSSQQPANNLQKKVEQTIAAIDTLTRRTDPGMKKTDSSYIYSSRIKKAFEKFKTDTSDKTKNELINTLKINTNKITNLKQKNLKLK